MLNLCNHPLPQSLVALASLFLLQFLVAVLRRNFRKMQKVVDNEPILLMVGSRMITENMSKARVTEDDLWAKIREANVIDLAQLRAVVMETTAPSACCMATREDRPLSSSKIRGL
jgi:uncharacterized membrane protein YcaP (DUF421 family)